MTSGDLFSGTVCISISPCDVMLLFCFIESCLFLVINIILSCLSFVTKAQDNFIPVMSCTCGSDAGDVNMYKAYYDFSRISPVPLCEAIGVRDIRACFVSL